MIRLIPRETKFFRMFAEVSQNVTEGARLLQDILKNPVDVPEYVLVSEELYQAGGAALFAPVNELSHELDGIGPVRTYHVDIAAVAGSLPAMPDPRLLERLGRTVDVAGRGLPYMLGLRRRRRVASGN